MCWDVDTGRMDTQLRLSQQFTFPSRDHTRRPECSRAHTPIIEHNYYLRSALSLQQLKQPTTSSGFPFLSSPMCHVSLSLRVFNGKCTARRQTQVSSERCESVVPLFRTFSPNLPFFTFPFPFQFKLSPRLFIWKRFFLLFLSGVGFVLHFICIRWTCGRHGATSKKVNWNERVRKRLPANNKKASIRQEPGNAPRANERKEETEKTISF